ncbi:hybrid sensor histidine kinase/response regulator [candidate division KSB1 bacterium]|nr:hybrid sensor histidine kinase/response regulator [candidate division KSB1 bacterium]
MSYYPEECTHENSFIFIVDSNTENVNLLIDLFQGTKIDCEAVSDGFEALDKIKNRKPDLILIDIIPPGLDGFQLCENFKNNPELKDIPVVFTTTKTDSQYIVKGFESGAGDFIIKPYDSAELLIRLQTHIKNKLHYDELRLINQTKNKFLSLIAHDLRNPFTILLNFSEILYQNFDEFSDEKKKDYLKYILESSQQSYDLMENLFRWARSQSGIMEFYPSRINITEVIKEYILFTKGYVQNKNLNVTFRADMNVFVEADRNMVATVIRNLLLNAIKYTKEYGKIFIETKIRNKFAEISITDTGIGIEKERLDQLFRIDRKVKTAGTNREGGTGLGLILCKEFIEKHGGKIWVESKTGEGSKFTFSIPLAESR